VITTTSAQSPVFRRLGENLLEVTFASDQRPSVGPCHAGRPQGGQGRSIEQIGCSTCVACLP
jgi:hypothetical protein